MATYSINQMKKEIKKLEKINIVGEKAILNIKVLDLNKLKEQDKIMQFLYIIDEKINTQIKIINKYKSLINYPSLLPLHLLIFLP